MDGILFHQILQIHAMLSARIPTVSMDGMRVNMFADGLFPAVVWIVTLAGIIAFWRTLNQPRDYKLPGLKLTGFMLAGWGWFNLVEGAVDHHVLQLHHVVEAQGLSAWDWAFLAAGIILIGTGHAMARSHRLHSAP